MEERLKESEEKYQHLIKLARSAIYELDYKTGKLVYVNDAMQELSGYTRKELLSLNPVDLLTKEGKNIFLERRKKLLAGEEVPNEMEYQIKRKDGELVWGLFSIGYLYEDNKVRGAIVVANDITERKEMQQRLEESEENYRLISENANDLIAIINEKLEYEYINEEAYKNTLGYSKEDLILKRNLEF